LHIVVLFYDNGKVEVLKSSAQLNQNNPIKMSTAPYGYPAPQAIGGYGAFPPQYGFGAQPQQFGAPQQYAGGVERQVVPEFVQVPVSQTVMVPQTTYQQRMIQVPVQQTIQVPRVVRIDFMTLLLNSESNLNNANFCFVVARSARLMSIHTKFPRSRWSRTPFSARR
jgi:hypothetical protein